MWRKRLMCLVAVCLSTALVIFESRAADETRQADEQAIRAAAEKCLTALRQGDAKALAACWTDDGQFTDELGQTRPATELIAAVQPSADGDASPATVTASRIRFLTPDVAIEDGTSEVGDQDASEATKARGRFQATWVKQQGQWRLANLCEMPEAAASDPRLAELEPFVGTWTAEAGGVRMEAVARFSDGGTFLVRETTAERDGKLVLSTTQRIGWDPLSGRLKSWTFDSAGGHAEAVWTKEGDSWVEQATGVLPDGRPATATAVITFENPDTLVRKLLAARIDGEAAPDSELRFERQTAGRPE